MFDNLFENFEHIHEARNNEIAPQNLYSTDVIKNLAEGRDDDYEEFGEFIFVKPRTQPCEYARYTNREFCVSNKDKPDWGMFTQHMKPQGSEFIFIFRKSDDGRNRKKLREYDVMALATWGSFSQRVSQMDSDEIGQMMYQRMQEHFDGDGIYTNEELTDYAQGLHDTNFYAEIYSSSNKLIHPEKFFKIMNDGGVSKTEITSLV